MFIFIIINKYIFSCLIIALSVVAFLTFSCISYKLTKQINALFAALLVLPCDKTVNLSLSFTPSLTTSRAHEATHNICRHARALLLALSHAFALPLSCSAGQLVHMSRERAAVCVQWRFSGRLSKTQSEIVAGGSACASLPFRTLSLSRLLSPGQLLSCDGSRGIVLSADHYWRIAVQMVSIGIRLLYTTRRGSPAPAATGGQYTLVGANGQWVLSAAQHRAASAAVAAQGLRRIQYA